MNNKLNKLNFGCGSIQPEGWVNVDSDIQFKTIITTETFKDNSFDVIVAHCSLQMVPLLELPALLLELKRILKAGGVLRISLPDIVEGFRQLEKDNRDWFPNNEFDTNDRFSAWLTWYSTSKTLLTKTSLIHKLSTANFSEIRSSQFKKSTIFTDEITELDTRENECYFVEARK